MKTIHKNAVVIIHGEVSKDKVKAAAEKFLKEVTQNEKKTETVV